MSCEKKAIIIEICLCIFFWIRVSDYLEWIRRSLHALECIAIEATRFSLISYFEGLTIMQREKPNYLIRPMEIDDLSAVFHLGEKVFTSKKLPNAFRTWDEYEVTVHFQSNGEHCFVAEDNHGLIGFVLGTTIEKNHPSRKYGYLTWLGVKPDHARGGVGKALVYRFLESMKEAGVRRMIVDTDADNTAAIAFFKTLGFANPKKHIYLGMTLGNGKSK